MSLSGKTALLVDDDPELRKLLRQILGNVGLEIFEAGAVTPALAAVKAHHPHLIFLDLNIGAESGFEFLEKFAREPEFGRTPVVVLSARTDQASISQALALGAREYLSKPLRAPLILQKARKLLRTADFLSVEFAEAQPGRVEIPGTIVRGSEGGLVVESPLRMSREGVVSLASTVAQEMGFERAPLLKSTVALPKFLPRGGFANDLRFMGLSSEMIARLRGIIERWHTK